ncbi:uncharacterized protein LOC125039655 [Penaeus chinensis]|uniref:uncharacterized protein LOC125039655 n=1 Tax=Penaeus chinensis TaxID=139456 RepID=UPI001FB79E70|nr:uncharacterized protein LOC125039655 [Penaeus chinensis]
MTSISCLLIICISAMNYAPSAAFCLHYMSCYNEAFLVYDKFEIHHEDHEVRSASVCAGLCLREDPETPMVFVTVIKMNERLVCGCGDEAALGNRSGTLNDFYCKKCPDSEEKCGGMGSISVYFIVHKEDECGEPGTTARQTTTPTTSTATTKTITKEPTQPSTQEDLLLLGCYRDSVTQVELAYLSDPEATVNACAATCNRTYPEKEMYMVKYNGTGLLCGCGHESSLSESSQAPESECDFRCGDSSLPCGGIDSFSAYRNTGWAARMPWSLILFLAAVLTISR